MTKNCHNENLGHLQWNAVWVNCQKGIQAESMLGNSLEETFLPAADGNGISEFDDIEMLALGTGNDSNT